MSPALRPRSVPWFPALLALGLAACTPAAQARAPLSPDGRADAAGIDAGRVEPAAADADTADAEAWLARMVAAIRDLDYEARLVWLDGEGLDVIELAHRGGPDGERERLRVGPAADGAPTTELVFADGALRGRGPGAPPRLLAPRPQPGLGGLLGGWHPGLRAHYAPRMLGRARIAGRPARVLALAPRDGLRYGLRLWLDEASALPLRVAVLEGDAVLEQVAVSALRLGPVPAEALAPGPGLAPIALPPADRVVEDIGWRVDAPPPGFALRAAGRDGDARWLVYDDGLASVSVLLEPAAPGAPGREEAGTRRGALTGLARDLEGWRVFIIGKVPPAAILRFAEGLRPGPDGP